MLLWDVSSHKKQAGAAQRRHAGNQHPQRPPRVRSSAVCHRDTSEEGGAPTAGKACGRHSPGAGSRVGALPRPRAAAGDATGSGSTCHGDGVPGSSPTSKL